MFVIPEELMKLKREEYITRNQRMQLRANNAELRELERELRIAECAMGLSHQRKAQERQKKETAAATLEEQLRVNAENQKATETFKRLEETKKAKCKTEMCIQLANQVTEQNAVRLAKCQEVLAEQEQLKRLQRQLEEEDKALESERQLQFAQLKVELLAEIDARKLQEQQKKAQEVLYVQALAEQQRSAEIRARVEIAQRQQKLQETLKLSDLLGQRMLKLEEAKEKREYLMLELHEQEYKEKQEAQLRAQLEKEQAERQKYTQELQQYRQTVLSKKELLAQKAQDPYITAERQQREQEEQARIQKEDESKAKRLEYGRDILAMIAENRRQRAKELSESLKLSSLRLEEDKKRERMVQEERLAILSDHPPELLRFVRKGVLREHEMPNSSA